MHSFQHYLEEASSWSLDGWDFSSLKDRWHEQSPSWDYRQRVIAMLPEAKALLDMDTGGGEFLAQLPQRPALCCATEGYEPNIAVARDRLTPLGIDVAAVHADATLPYDDNSFDLIINRHGAFDARELARILKPGGHFVTQQVGCQDNQAINRLLGAPESDFSKWTLATAQQQLQAAGMQIVVAEEEFPPAQFDDIGVLMIYLKAIPWQIAGYQVEQYQARLRAAHQQISPDSPFTCLNHRFYLQATLPG